MALGSSSSICRPKVVEPEGRDDDDDPHRLRCYILIDQDLAALEALRSISRRPVSGPAVLITVSQCLFIAVAATNAASAVSQ